MLTWEKLLSPVRRKKLHSAQESMGTGAGRAESERDYDRILFTAPTRRLADKTQVFPMDESDYVRTRLTHSHEVSNLARSIGVRLAFENAEKIFGADHEALQVRRVVPSILAAAGLAHDLGNPPFGHQGEVAMQQWFAETRDKGLQMAPDFIEFDGNAQTFRLLTRLQVLNDNFGLNLTLGTLATLVKYPSIYGSGDKHGFKKHGIFQSEAEVIQEVWTHTGLAPGIRHPLAYVVEACDDIAYSIIDAEDTVKKGYASFYDVMDFLKSYDPSDPVILEVVEKSCERNKEFRKNDLSSRELNDISMQMFRVKAISEMIVAATNTFVTSAPNLLNGSVAQGFELIAASRSGPLCKAAKQFDLRHGFQQKDVLKLELQGNNYIKGMMDMIWGAIQNEEAPNRPFERYVFGVLSENYRRVYSQSKKDAYAQCQLLGDAVSGMTDSYLVNKHKELRSLQYVRT